jgi:hypothetical protein
VFLENRKNNLNLSSCGFYKKGNMYEKTIDFIHSFVMLDFIFYGWDSDRDHTIYYTILSKSKLYRLIDYIY